MKSYEGEYNQMTDLNKIMKGKSMNTSDTNTQADFQKQQSNNKSQY
jgi:hypothetical protein